MMITNPNRCYIWEPSKKYNRTAKKHSIEFKWERWISKATKLQISRNKTNFYTPKQ